MTAISEAQNRITAKGIVELKRLRGLIETTLDIAPLQIGSSYAVARTPATNHCQPFGTCFRI